MLPHAPKGLPHSPLSPAIHPLKALCWLKLGLLVMACGDAPPSAENSMSGGSEAQPIASGGGDPFASGGNAAEQTGGTSPQPEATGGMPPVVDDDFELVWREDFDSFNQARWRMHDHTFPENASYFSHDNISVENGKLILRATVNEAYPINDDDKPYRGAEVSTQELFGYMRITARIKFARGKGMVSSLFTFSDDAGTFWNEIDVEYLGYKEEAVQYNLISSKCLTCGGDRNSTPYPDEIGVKPYEDFYEYQITYTPEGVSFKVGDLPTRWSHYDPAMTAPMRIRMNVWPTSGVDPFAGVLDPQALPTQAEYDWIQVERYVGN